jgi:putative aldouronate transport system substrate-binding protein
MRKGIMKKALSLVLTTVMATMTVVGCGSSATKSGSSGTSGNYQNGSYKDYSKGFDNQVTIKIPVYDRAFEGWDVTNNYYTQWVQKQFGDKYNVKVQYVAIGRTTEVADYMQMIAAGTAPDIIFNYDMPQAVNYYSEGAMQDLDLNEIAYYAPDYYSKMKDTISSYGKLDGKNSFFFAERNQIYYSWVNLIRQDWLDKVNMSMPTNLAEYEKVLAAWKAAGLGNGGGQLLQTSFTYEYNFLPSNLSDSDKAQYLDLNVAPFTWQPTKDYLKEQNKLYNAGLIDPEFYLNEKDADTKADFVSGKSGIYGFYISSGTDVMSSLLANNPNAKVATMDPGALAVDGKAAYYQYPPYGMIMGINSTTSDEQRAAIWMYLNWMSQPDNLFYLQNGVEGQNYTMQDGIASPTAGFTGASALSKNNNKDYWCLVQEVAHYDTEDKSYRANLKTLAPTGYEYLIQDAYKYAQKYDKLGVLTPIFTKTVDSSTEYTADLKAMWKQFYVDLATCPSDQFEAKYTKYSKDYLDGGYQKILDEKQKLIKEGSYITK